MKNKCILKAFNLFTFLLKLLFLLLASLITLIISLFPHHFPKEPADHSACSVSKYLMFIECIVLILLGRLLYLKLLILLFLLSLFLVQRSFLGLLYRFLLCRSFLSGLLLPPCCFGRSFIRLRCNDCSIVVISVFQSGDDIGFNTHNIKLMHRMIM